MVVLDETSQVRIPIPLGHFFQRFFLEDKRFVNGFWQQNGLRSGEENRKALWGQPAAHAQSEIVDRCPLGEAVLFAIPDQGQ